MQDPVDFSTKSFRLLVGADHGGWDVKARLIDYLEAQGVDVEDAGPYVLDPQDARVVDDRPVEVTLPRDDREAGERVERGDGLRRGL